MTNQKRKRSRWIKALLLPAIIFLWIVGWSLYWIGHQKESRKPQPPQSTTEEDHVTLETIALEEPIQTKS